MGTEDGTGSLPVPSAREGTATRPVVSNAHQSSRPKWGPGVIPDQGGAPVPANICERCGEFWPHWCAPVIRIRRAQWTSRRIVTITDRMMPGGR